MRRHLALFAAVTVALGVLAVSPASALTKPQVFSLVDVSVSSSRRPACVGVSPDRQPATWSRDPALHRYVRAYGR